jgi:hypothetical protein
MSSSKDVVAALRAVEDLLRKHGVNYATVVNSVRQTVESQGDRDAASTRASVRALFGGMGTLTDVVITKENGHLVEDERSANDELERAAQQLWETTEDIA